MATFPNTLSSATTFARVSQVESSMAVDGTMRYIDMGTDTFYQINCVVEALSATERDTLIDWLDTNETSDIDVVLRTGGPTYRGQLIYSEPVQWSSQSNLFKVEFALWAKKI